MKPPPGGRTAFTISLDARRLGDKHDCVILLCVIMRILWCEERRWRVWWGGGGVNGMWVEEVGQQKMRTGGGED